MKLLVTGFGGLIGGAVARLAASAGYEVHAIARRPVPEREGVNVHTIDLLTPDAGPRLIEKLRPTHLIHAAWETTQPTYWSSLLNLDWIGATAGLARAFAASGGQRFLQIGSCAEYDWSGGLCSEGVTPERPATRYGLAKLAAWKAVEAAAAGDFEAVEPRIFFVYGPGENRDRLIPYICRSHGDGLVPELSSGRQVRDLLHVEDAARAILAVAESTLIGVVNIGSGAPNSLGDAARILAACACSAESGLGRRPDRQGDPDRLLPDTKRLFSTGWRPRVPLKDGLSRTFSHWLQDQGSDQG